MRISNQISWLQLIVLGFAVLNMSHEIEAQPTEKNLSTRLVVNDAQVIAGDPVSLTLEITNSSQQAASVVRSQIQPPFKTTIIAKLLLPGEKNWRNISSLGAAQYSNKISSTPPLPVVTIEPGSRQAFDFILDYGRLENQASSYLFQTPGEYELKITFHVLPSLTREKMF